MSHFKNMNMLIVFTGLVALTLFSGQTFGQTFEKKYEEALLDSAYRYELLKPAYVDLQLVTKFQDERYKSMQIERMYEKESFQVQMQRIQNEARKNKRKAFWKGFKTGAAAVIVVVVFVAGVVIVKTIKV